MDSNKDDSHHPGLPLLYLVYKNLAAVAVARSSFVEGMQCYLKVIMQHVCVYEREREFR